MCLWVPAKTPQTRVNRIHAEIRKAVATPDMKAKLDDTFPRTRGKGIPDSRAVRHPE
jgi:tripartite-type tricarboxylate transporter receptor subunit TctC